jgi:hypothetical protein
MFFKIQKNFSPILSFRFNVFFLIGHEFFSCSDELAAIIFGTTFVYPTTGGLHQHPVKPDIPWFCFIIAVKMGFGSVLIFIFVPQKTIGSYINSIKQLPVSD